MKKTPLWLTKWLRFEFWPFWFFYAPVGLYFAWLALKARSLLYFTAVNPALRFGGILDVSKKDIITQIPTEFLPQTVVLAPHTQLPQALNALSAAQMGFPLVAKPNIGERGTGVEKIENETALAQYLAQHQTETLLQAFVNYPLELGVLYYRMPDGSRHGVTSVVIKGFLTVTGDGQQTLWQLMQQNERALMRQDYLKQKFAEVLHQIVPQGETLLLEPIGNHCRGTTFLNGNAHITPQLAESMAKIVANFEGFYYGRFDLKAKSWDDLYAGKHIKVLELNGVHSEPAHIYDPGMSLIQAYRDVLAHARLVYEISRQNHAHGVPYNTVGEFLRALQIHFKERR